ncbi:MAG: hypothetical protein LBL46_05080 [Rickettsiales bacterium]|nr:hypothetical protein [Rickettsiales bacterium]
MKKRIRELENKRMELGIRGLRNNKCRLFSYSLILLFSAIGGFAANGAKLCVVRFGEKASIRQDGSFWAAGTDCAYPDYSASRPMVGMDDPREHCGSGNYIYGDSMSNGTGRFCRALEYRQNGVVTTFANPMWLYVVPAGSDWFPEHCANFFNRNNGGILAFPGLAMASK